jgi:uncharacterized protein (TIGR02246 family)
MSDEKKSSQGKTLPKDQSEPPKLGTTLEDFLRPLSEETARSKSAADPVAVALEAMQRLALETDLQNVTDQVESTSFLCIACGNLNPPENRFCATCGKALQSAEIKPTANSRSVPQPRPAAPQSPADYPSAALPPGPHQYHHHYHHHYFSHGEAPAVGPLTDFRPANAAPARDASRSRSVPGAPLSRAEMAVRKVSQNWALACNTKHLDDLVTLYVPDATVLRPNVPAVRGTAAIREFFVSVLEAGLGEVEMESLRTEIIGDVAYEAGRCQMLVPVAMSKRREDRGKYLMVLTRHDGDWKILADCWSIDLSLGVPAEPAQKAQGGPPRKTS